MARGGHVIDAKTLNEETGEWEQDKGISKVKWDLFTAQFKREYYAEKNKEALDKKKQKNKQKKKSKKKNRRK